MQNGHSSFYIGVKHPQAQSLSLATVSRLQRVDTSLRREEDELDDEDEEDDSDESWQPDRSAE